MEHGHDTIDAGNLVEQGKQRYNLAAHLNVHEPKERGDILGHHRLGHAQVEARHGGGYFVVATSQDESSRVAFPPHNGGTPRDQLRHAMAMLL